MGALLTRGTAVVIFGYRECSAHDRSVLYLPATSRPCYNVFLPNPPRVRSLYGTVPVYYDHYFALKISLSYSICRLQLSFERP